MAYNLDLKDRRLLYELDLNSRQSFNELSKKLGLSKNSVAYRIKQLQGAGIIEKFHTIIDTGKLGYTTFRLYMQIQNATPEKEKEILNFFINHKLVTRVISIDGDYSVGCLILAKTIKEVSDFWRELLNKYVNYTGDRSLTIITGIKKFARAYFLEQKENKEESINLLTESNLVDLDESDIKLLKLLAEDSRTQIIDLASKLNLTSKTVISKIKKLEEQKVIVCYQTKFSLEKLGYQHFRVTFRLDNITKEKMKELINYANFHPNINYAHEVLGGDDFEIDIETKGLPELRLIIEDLKSRFMDIIQSYKTMQFYKEHEYEVFPI